MKVDDLSIKHRDEIRWNSYGHSPDKARIIKT